jgi:hypothetical protein
VAPENIATLCRVKYYSTTYDALLIIVRRMAHLGMEISIVLLGQAMDPK